MSDKDSQRAPKTGSTDTDRAPDEGGGARRWFWPLAGAAVLLVGGLVFWLLARPEDGQAQPPPDPPLVRGAVATAADRLIIRQTGFVRARSTVSVAAEIGGRIAEIGEGFRVGGFVDAGDLLIRLDTDQIEADVTSARAAVDRSRAALAEARVARDRQQQLEQSNFTSEAALQEAIVRVATAKADLSAAEANLTQARERLDQAGVTAPFDAFVTAESASLGALVQPGTDVGTLVSAEAAEIEMGLTPPDLDVLGQAERALGGRVILRGTDRGAPMLGTGEVISVDPDIAAQTRTVGLVVTVRSPFAEDSAGARPLRVGELVALELPVSLGGRAVTSVPPEAVKGQELVWVIKDGTLHRRDVRILQRGEGRVLLDGRDLAPGTRVLLSDMPDAIEGQSVRLESKREAPEADADGNADDAG